MSCPLLKAPLTELGGLLIGISPFNFSQSFALQCKSVCFDQFLPKLTQIYVQLLAEQLFILDDVLLADEGI